MNPYVPALLLFVGGAAFVYTMYGRLSALFGMKKENRLDHVGQRLQKLLLFGLGQKRMVDPEERGPGMMHVLIFAAFMVLALRTVMLFVMGFSDSAVEVFSTPSSLFWAEHPPPGAVFNLFLLSHDPVTPG